jgi:hypothetical protein
MNFHLKNVWVKFEKAQVHFHHFKGNIMLPINGAFVAVIKKCSATRLRLSK